jgi:hypothetical protein
VKPSDGLEPSINPVGLGAVALAELGRARCGRSAESANRLEIRNVRVQTRPLRDVAEHRCAGGIGVLCFHRFRDLRQRGWDGARIARVRFAERGRLPKARLGRRPPPRRPPIGGVVTITPPVRRSATSQGSTSLLRKSTSVFEEALARVRSQLGRTYPL